MVHEAPQYTHVAAAEGWVGPHRDLRRATGTPAGRNAACGSGYVRVMRLKINRGRK
jgi:hypothetical protein